MHVKLIGYTSDPEKLPAMAATLTHSKTKPEDLQNLPIKKQTAILEQVLKLGHTSVIEHASFTFAISLCGIVSRVTLSKASAMSTSVSQTM
jgi:thymidylate synthase (FAD)